MSKIFLSHASDNNAQALAVAKWLKENGWADYFLDIEPARGLAPGERWQEALKRAANRCEAVLCLISSAWRDSPHCLAEFMLAKYLGKTVFGVLIEPTPLDTLPRELTAEWQLCDLVSGSERLPFVVSYDPIVPKTEVSLSEVGLARLKVGLQRSEVEPSSFQWPPLNEPDRAPYRGLKALEAEDAAVFFGREAAIVRGLDALRAVRGQGVARMFVILGASGSGKSSFLRAGLWPRLVRDDLEFLPLPVIRPGRAAIDGASGLVASLERAFRERNATRTRAAIRSVLHAPRGLAQLLAELQRLARSGLESEATTPTVVISIDQGEELASAEGRTEAEAFLAMLAQALLPSEKEDGRRLALAIVAIRSDSYEGLLSERSLESIVPHLFRLPPIARAEFKAVIEGPAARATSAGRKLAVQPTLTEKLLLDADGADALPLLAFTLERLYVEHAADGDLRLDEYVAFGGVRGSIEAAVDAAFDEPGRAPAVPAGKAEREALLRKAFVPWLAGVDPQTEERKRRVARWEELPLETHPLLERLIAVRLLVRDSRKLEADEKEVVTIEVAHEALLRQWPTLTAWLDTDADALKTLDGARRLADEWVKNGRTDDWLAHTGERLASAEQIRRRPDFDRLLGVDGAAYLEACRTRDDTVRRDREVQLQRVARAQRRVALVLALIAVVLAGAAIFGWHQAGLAATGRNQALVAQSKALSSVSRQQTDQGFATLGVLLALEALPREHGKGRPFVSSAEAALLYALLAQREKHVLASHEDGVNQVRFSPQGSLVVTVSRDGTAGVWNATTGNVISILKGHKGQIYGAEFSPDGERVVTVSSDKTARLWNVETGENILLLEGHEGDVYRASWSPNGRHIVTASDDGTARVWDSATGQPLFRLQGHGGPVVSAYFSLDGNRVLTASTDGTSKVWSAETGRVLATLVGHAKGVYHAGFSPDGQRIVTASWDHTARLWDGATGRLIAILRGHQDGVGRAAFSPGGELVATASADGTARLWDGSNGKAIAELRGHSGPVHDAQFSLDGRRLVTAADDGTARIWDVSTRRTIQTLRGHGGRVWTAVLSPDGHYSATASEDNTARIWDITPRILAAELKAHRGPVQRAIFARDGHLLVTVSEDSTARIWNPETGSEIAILTGHERGIWYACISGDGKRLVTTSADGTARLWDTATHRLIHTLSGHEGLVNHAHFSPDGKRVVTAGSEGTARVWDVASGQTLTILQGHNGSVNFVEFSHDGQRIVTASQDNTSRLWRADTGELIAVLEGHRGPVINGTFSPDDSRLATASWDRTARLWDGTSGKALSTLQSHTDAVLSVGFSADGRLAVTASSDNTARIWDAATGNPLFVLQSHGGEVYEASFSSDARLILTASVDGTARLWHVGSGLLVATLEGHGGPVVSATFAPAGRYIATASWDHTARLWRLPVGTDDDWIGYARETAPRTLTDDERRLYL